MGRLFGRYIHIKQAVIHLGFCWILLGLIVQLKCSRYYILKQRKDEGMTKDENEFGKLIRKLRQDMDISQGKFARKLDLIFFRALEVAQQFQIQEAINQQQNSQHDILFYLLH